MNDRNRPLEPEDHFGQLADWLELESIAERERLTLRRQRMSSANVESTGETLVDLVVEDHHAGVGGLFLLTLVKRNRNQILPWNRLRVGSPVMLSPMDDESADETWTGVVSERSNRSIQVAVDEWPDGQLWRLDLTPDEMTRRRQLAAMGAVVQARGRLAEMRRILLNQRAPVFRPVKELDLPSTLNPSQREAIQFALSAEDLAIIHGPPGTGKTTTVVQLIAQIVERDEQVLACAPSNTAVDNLLERLVALGIRAVRLGHPARVSASLRDHSLDALAANHPNMRVVRDLMRQAETMVRKASKYTRAKPARGVRQQARNEARALRFEARQLEDQAVRHILDRAQVVCATTTLDDELLGSRHFEWVIIDEACQSTEPGCWVPVLRAQRLVLAGDHCQLPPTVLSAQAAKEGFERSLMQRLVETYGNQTTRRLDVQYRMHEQIMQFSSQQFYDGELHADPSVRHHRLSDLPHVRVEGAMDDPVTFIDTAGTDWFEEQEPDGESRLNPSEGQVVLRKVDQLMAAGLGPHEIAVIAPYAAQVRWLRQRSPHAQLEIDTVDGFQGREKEAVVISMVRSNREGEIGFLGDRRRMNVALTRARRKLILVGDSATLGAHPFYRDLLEYIESIGAYHSAWEELGDS